MQKNICEKEKICLKTISAKKTKHNRQKIVRKKKPRQKKQILFKKEKPLIKNENKKREGI